MNIRTWRASYTPIDAQAGPVPLGILFEHEARIRSIFIGYDGLDPDVHESDPDEELLRRANIPSLGGLKNWVFLWTTLLKRDTPIDDIIKQGSPYYEIKDDVSINVEDNDTAASIAQRLRRERLTPPFAQDRRPLSEVDAAMLIEEACWLVPKHGEDLRRLARVVLRGGEFRELKPIFIRYEWLVEPLRRLHRRIETSNDEFSAARLGAALHVTLEASRYMSHPSIEHALGTLLVNWVGQSGSTTSRDVHFSDLAYVLCFLTEAGFRELHTTSFETQGDAERFLFTHLRVMNVNQFWWLERLQFTSNSIELLTTLRRLTESSEQRTTS